MLGVTLSQALTVEHDKKKNKKKSNKKLQRCHWNWDCPSGDTCTTKTIKNTSVSVCVT